MYELPDYANRLRFKAIMLTPEYAERLLAKNHPHNRPMKKAKIQQMVMDIQAGNWRLTPEPIVISDDDILLDGQNRCTACSMSGVAIPVYTCSGLPEGAMVAMDCGTSRNVADAARIMQKDIKGVNEVAAVARRMAHGLTRQDRLIGLSIQETLAWIETHRKALEFSFECLYVSKPGITQAGVRAVIARAYYHRPIEETRARCKTFGEILISGLVENPKKDSAAIRLRNFLQDNFSRGTRTKNVGARISPTVVYAKTEVALQHFLAYNPVESLKETSKELFPLPSENGKQDEEAA